MESIGMPIRNRTQAFEWYHIWWPWTTVIDFEVMPLFDAEWLRNGIRYIVTMTLHVQIGTYLHTAYSRVLFRMTLSNLERLSKIFSDMKHHAVSLRHVSLLLGYDSDWLTVLLLVWLPGLVKAFILINKVEFWMMNTVSNDTGNQTHGPTQPGPPYLYWVFGHRWERNGKFCV